MMKRWMRNQMPTCFVRKSRESASIWKALGLLGMVLAAVFAILAAVLKKKNDVYMKALIDLSDQIPEDEEDGKNRSQWHSAHAPANQKTVEERLADQRVHEE